MRRDLQFPARKKKGFTLIEALITLVAIGIITAIAIPAVSSLRTSAKRAAARQNAKNIAQMSEALAGVGVAHVIPDSLGGVAATTRLLREGIVVPKGAFAGETFVLSGILDTDIDDISEFLSVQYFATELKLVYQDPYLNSQSALIEQGPSVLCIVADRFRAPSKCPVA